MIAMRRRQLSFADGLIAEEVHLRIRHSHCG
jgi:hypothetical protein